MPEGQSPREPLRHPAETSVRMSDRNLRVGGIRMNPARLRSGRRVATAGLASRMGGNGARPRITPEL